MTNPSWIVPTGLFINNEFVPAKNGETIDVHNPTNNEKIATIASAGPADIDAAVRAADTALATTWRTTTSSARAKLLNKLADLIERDADELATIEALDAGVLHGDSTNLNIPQATDTLRFYAKIADQTESQMLDIPGGYAQVLRQPYGICAAIVPWNAPL